MTQTELEDRLTTFAGRCIRVCEALPAKRLGSTQLADQLFRSSTSVAANYAEATQAESRKDFIHKIKIAEKELTEAKTWLKIIVAAKRIPASHMNTLLTECDELIRILGASIATAKQHLGTHVKGTTAV